MAQQRSAKSSSAAWSDAVSTWEKSVNSMANATMANDEFSGVMNQAMKLTLLMQQSLGNVMAVYLSALNIPSKAEVAALGERLQTIELRLDRMTSLLEKLANSAPAPAPSPAAAPEPSKSAAAPAPAASTTATAKPSATGPTTPTATAAKPAAPAAKPVSLTPSTSTKPMPPRTKKPPSRAKVAKK